MSVGGTDSGVVLARGGFDLLLVGEGERTGGVPGGDVPEFVQGVSRG